MYACMHACMHVCMYTLLTLLVHLYNGCHLFRAYAIGLQPIFVAFILIPTSPHTIKYALKVWCWHLHPQAHSFSETEQFKLQINTSQHQREPAVQRKRMRRSETIVYLPKLIISRWNTFLKSDRKRKKYWYVITTALEVENVDKEEFLKCWKFVRPRTRPEEVFSWFKDAGFGQIHSTSARKSLRVAFVRKILQRYKDIKVYACIHVRFALVLVRF